MMKLADHPFIQSIAQAQRADTVAEIELIQLSHNTVFLEEKSESDALFLILEGSVDLCKKKGDSSLQIIRQATAGGFIGELGVFTGEPLAMTAIARGDVQIAKVPKTLLNKLLEDPAPLRHVLDGVIDHLGNTTDNYLLTLTQSEKLSMVGTMMSSLLHDFKNPFSVVSLGASLIGQRHSDNPKTVRICQNINRQVTRMVNMANDLAAYSSGDSQIEHSYVSFEDLFYQFQELNIPYFKDESVKLEMHANGSSMQGDAGKLFRVLQNLVNNAIEAFHYANMEGRIEVTASEVNDSVVLIISDDGPGIPDNILDRFFEPFVTFGKNEGTGLGSAIVKSIVDAHKGSIDLKTDSGGTTFTIHLPKSAQ